MSCLTTCSCRRVAGHRHALAQSLRKLDPPRPPGAGCGGVASRAVGQGHAGFDPARPQMVFDGPMDWPGAGEWNEALADSRWIDRPCAHSPASTSVPLVLEHGLLYLRRYRQYEFRLATRLQQMAAHVPPAGDVATLAPLFGQLFPEARQGSDRQAHAAATALLRSLLLVTGGPGNGKNTTIARLLLLLMAQAMHSGGVLPRVALAAPTGRAAERMAESLRNAVPACACCPAWSGLVRCNCPPRPAPAPPARHHSGQPALPFRCRQSIAVRHRGGRRSVHGRPAADVQAGGSRAGRRALVMLGDRTSYVGGAGDVLSAILAAAEMAMRPPFTPRCSPAWRPRYGGSCRTPPLSGHHVHLLRGYRQAATLDLSPLATPRCARAMPTTALALLRGGQLVGVHFHENLFDPLAAQRETLLAHWHGLRT